MTGNGQGAKGEGVYMGKDSFVSGTRINRRIEMLSKPGGVDIDKRLNSRVNRLNRIGARRSHRRGLV